jgi:hypothetical protein
MGRALTGLGRVGPDGPFGHLYWSRAAAFATGLFHFAAISLPNLHLKKHAVLSHSGRLDRWTIAILGATGHHPRLDQHRRNSVADLPLYEHFPKTSDLYIISYFNIDVGDHN